MIVEEDISKRVLAPKSEHELHGLYSSMSSRDLLLKGISSGNLEAVKKAVKKIDPSFDDNTALELATKKGEIEIVDFLLKDSRVDPSNNGNQNILWAAVDRGHASVVKRLLKDPRVDPTVNDNEILLHAAALGKYYCVKELLKDGRVDAQNTIKMMRTTNLIRAQWEIYQEIQDILWDYTIKKGQDIKQWLDDNDALYVGWVKRPVNESLNKFNAIKESLKE